jgi:very-short-patch-repair endonuclease
MTEFFNRSSEKDLRRRLRKELTPAEAELWSRLHRGQLGGHRFRRQYSVGPYCVDFYCVQAKLAIEVDGDSHFTAEAKQSDPERQRYVEAFGIRFLRFTNADVYDNPDGVIEAIARALGPDEEPPVSPLRKGGGF